MLIRLHLRPRNQAHARDAHRDGEPAALQVALSSRSRAPREVKIASLGCVHLRPRDQAHACNAHRDSKPAPLQVALSLRSRAPKMYKMPCWTVSISGRAIRHPASDAHRGDKPRRQTRWTTPEQDTSFQEVDYRLDEIRIGCASPARTCTMRHSHTWPACRSIGQHLLAQLMRMPAEGGPVNQLNCAVFLQLNGHAKRASQQQWRQVRQCVVVC